MQVSGKAKLTREQLNISKESLAKEININFSTLNRWVNGHQIPFFRAQDKFYKFCKDNGVIFDKADGELHGNK